MLTSMLRKKLFTWPPRASALHRFHVKEVKIKDTDRSPRHPSMGLEQRYPWVTWDLHGKVAFAARRAAQSMYSDDLGMMIHRAPNKRDLSSRFLSKPATSIREPRVCVTFLGGLVGCRV